MTARRTLALLLGLLLLGLAQPGCSGVSPTPRLDEVLPASALRDRPTRLRLHGEGFAPLIEIDSMSGSRVIDARFQVHLGDLALTEVERISDTELWATCPPGAPLGAADLVVTDPRGRTARLPGGVTVLDGDSVAPRVVFETPAPGPVPAGATVTVRLFARDPSPGLVTDLTLEADAGAPRSAQVVVEPALPEVVRDLDFRMPTDLPEGTRVLLTARARDDAPQPNVGEATLELTVGPPLPGPQIFSIVPGRGPIAGGQAVVVTGTGFTVDTVIDLGGSALLSPVLEGPTRIRARTPPHAAGDVDVTARDPLGTMVVAGGYHYGQPPLIVGLEPVFGVETGGDTVIVTGYGLDQATAVHFGVPVGSALTLVDTQTVRVTTPPGRGAVDVVLDGAAGETDRVALGFTYLPRLGLEQVRPPMGQAGRTVNLKGGGFTVGMKVFFGGVPATGLVVVDATTARLTVPPGAGPVDVVVSNAVSTATLANGFRYN